MNYGHTMRYIGDEILLNVKVADPDLDRFNKLKDKPFVYFVANVADEAFVKEFVRRKAKTKAVLKTDKKGTPLRRFPFRIEEDLEGTKVTVYTEKKSATGDVFRHTGEFLPNGDPVYICKGIADTAYAQLKNLRTFEGKLTLYEEIEDKTEAGILEGLKAQIVSETEARVKAEKALAAMKK